VLAGALLLFLPGSLGAIADARALFTSGARMLLGAIFGIAGFGCMYWSGSKAGWLLMMLMGLVTLLHLPFGKRYQVALLTVVIVFGTTGFFWKYSGYFNKGATSVSARTDYWRAALQTTRERPVFGTGPGTFEIAYQRVKRPESEPSRLTHNDYLEQASDSGLPGFFLYTVFILGALFCGSPYAKDRKLGIQSPGSGVQNRVKGTKKPSPEPPGIGQHTEDFCAWGQNWTAFGLWLGVLGWAVQGLVEFGLYIPALAWPAFALLGWLLGRKGRP
jgi:hypothetical protein